MKKFNTYNVEYTDNKNVTTKREVFTLTEVPTLIQVLDMSDLTEDQKTQLITARKEYDQYVQNYMAQMFSFEDWLTHSNDDLVAVKMIETIKFRKFKTDKIKII